MLETYQRIVKRTPGLSIQDLRKITFFWNIKVFIRQELWLRDLDLEMVF